MKIGGQNSFKLCTRLADTSRNNVGLLQFHRFNMAANCTSRFKTVLKPFAALLEY